MSAMEINLPGVLAEVRAVFARYEDALVNNRVDMLDALFWPSAHTVRYGIAENLHGIAAIRAFRAARPATGLARTLSDTVITTYGQDFATAMTEFHRAGSAKIGRQSQTWVRMPAGWQVVAAHVSLIDPPVTLTDPPVTLTDPPVTLTDPPVTLTDPPVGEPVP